jgi:ketosteroid isomerase-like protein
MHSWKEIDPKIEIFGDGAVAVVAYRYETSFDMGGKTMNVSGRDMMSLVKEEGRWRVVADHFAPFPT